MNIIHTILDLRWFILVLGILVFVHELGHFMMARRIGVRVLTFSLGFGPKLFSFRRGDTEYCVRAIPLGGYVKMAGDNPKDGRTGASDEFLSKSKWQRFQVLVMGPVMNLALALIVMALVLYHNGADGPAFAHEQVIVGSVDAGSPAAQAGIQPGDHITEVASVPVDNWEDFWLETVTKANRPIALTIARNGKTFEQAIVPVGRGKYEEGVTGIKPIVRPQIVSVVLGEPAQESGLRAGDAILSVNGQKPVVTWSGPDSKSAGTNVTEVIRTSEGKPLTFQVLRDGQPREIAVTPRRTNDLVRIGAQINPVEVRVVRPVFPGVQAECRTELEGNEDDHADARRAVHRGHAGETVDGAGGDRGLVGRSRPGGLDPAVHPGDDPQPQSGAAQPDARAGPRRRPHHDPCARGPVAPRLQHEDEKANAPRRPGADADADGDGHLQ